MQRRLLVPPCQLVHLTDDVMAALPFNFLHACNDELCDSLHTHREELLNENEQIEVDIINLLQQ